MYIRGIQPLNLLGFCIGNNLTSLIMLYMINVTNKTTLFLHQQKMYSRSKSVIRSLKRASFLPACVHDDSEKPAFNRKLMFKNKGSKSLIITTNSSAFKIGCYDSKHRKSYP